jgi:hypothetical protein
LRPIGIAEVTGSSIDSIGVTRITAGSIITATDVNQEHCPKPGEFVPELGVLLANAAAACLI